MNRASSKRARQQRASSPAAWGFGIKLQVINSVISGCHASSTDKNFAPARACGGRYAWFCRAKLGEAWRIRPTRPTGANSAHSATHTQVRGPSSAAGQNLKCQKDSKHTANSKSGGNMQLTRLRGTAVSQAPTSTGRHSGEGRVACRQPMLAGQQPGSIQQQLTRILGILTRHASRPRAQHGDAGKALATQRARPLLSSRGTTLPAGAEQTPRSPTLASH